MRFSINVQIYEYFIICASFLKYFVYFFHLRPIRIPLFDRFFLIVFMLKLTVAQVSKAAFATTWKPDRYPANALPTPYQRLTNTYSGSRMAVEGE